MYISALTQGWTNGRNVRMDLRSAVGDINRIRALAQELVGLQPDFIVTGGNLATAAVQREARTIPIVFGNVADPVACGLVPRLDRPSACPCPSVADRALGTARSSRLSRNRAGRRPQALLVGRKCPYVVELGKPRHSTLTRTCRITGEALLV